MHSAVVHFNTTICLAGSQSLEIYKLFITHLVYGGVLGVLYIIIISIIPIAGTIERLKVEERSSFQGCPYQRSVLD